MNKDKMIDALKLAKACTYADEMTEGAKEYLRINIDEALKQGQPLPIDIIMPCGDCSIKTSPCRTINCQYSKVHKA
jgi:hypothetical protein